MKSALELECAKIIDLLMLKLHVTNHKDMATDHWQNNHERRRDLLLEKIIVCAVCGVVGERHTYTNTKHNLLFYFEQTGGSSPASQCIKNN